MKVVVIGAQWGDEGKGKIVDYLAGEANIIIRFAGGANAGNNIVIDGQRYTLRLVPSGIFYPGKISILGAGMVIDPKALFDEIRALEERGVDTEGRVLVSDRAHLVLPRYVEMDRELGAAEGRARESSGLGIGTTYSMKSKRHGIRVADLAWKDRMAELSAEDRDFLEPFVERLIAMSINLSAYLADWKDSHVLFEGAQGTMLDLDIGTYPYVSSGMSSAAGATVGGCIGPRALDRILGVFKAYSTRAGNGPLPSEFDPDSRDGLFRIVRETGLEFGDATGWPGRCGYLDLVSLRYACQTNSIDSLAMTRFDVYDTLDEIKVCVAYRVGDRTVEKFPASIEDLSNARPVLRTFKGWKRSLSEVADYEAFPDEAKDYIDFIESYCETPIDIVSLGYERRATIVRKNPWAGTESAPEKTSWWRKK